MAGPKGPLLCLALCLKDAQIFSLAMKKKWLKGLYQLHAVPARRNLSPSCLCYTNSPYSTRNHLNMRLELKKMNLKHLSMTLTHLHLRLSKRAVQARGSDTASSQGSEWIPASRDSLFMISSSDIGLD